MASYDSKLLDSFKNFIKEDQFQDYEIYDSYFGNVVLTMVVSMMRVNLLNNLLFSLRAHPYHLGAICQTMTDRGISYANNTPICLN